MKYVKRFAPHVVRILLGLLFAFAGASWFVAYFSGDSGGEGPTEGFIGGLTAAGYMFPLIKATELATAIAFLTNRFVPLALVVLAPVVVNISLFHFVLTPGHDTALSIALPVALVYLAWVHREAFRPLLRPRYQAGAGKG